MAGSAIAMEAVKAKVTGGSVLSVGTAYAVTKAELKAKLMNSIDNDKDEEKEEDTTEEKEISFWDTWRYRLMFLTGCVLGAAFIG
eukprot:CAMPEP_0114529548 /NCGR_PEP_ID=MMETSP0109-20121206/24909_1 /TAXON_ID=29199 /ORGANISM="Chlorarachnion reptans, Strain CCCM449" /LENGTH=84 /DNA_ID=CAMNT_0001711989 /DNA_START=36 /DNA_END=287 /DNA_ORIENTATION=+